jgi:WhiB family redox-sensing transcriptional regulator
MKTEVEMLPYNPDDEMWREHALCANMDVNEFFPEKGVNIGHLKEFCGRCPVARECVDYAVKYTLEHGVWGGTSPHDRREIRMGRKVNPHAAVRR